MAPDFAKDGTQSENSQDWVNSMMPPDGAQARIFRFEYRIALDRNSIWHQLSEKGEDLLRIFHRMAWMYQVRFRKLISDMLDSFNFDLKLLEKPLIFIGHGLGGLIIKRVRYHPKRFSLLTSRKALSVLSDPAMSADPAMQVHNKDILNLVAGVLFFGTPHTKTKKPEQWCRLTLLLNFAARLPKRFLAHSEADANAAAIICEDFEQSGLEAPVLSIYETRPTKVRSARWMLKDTVMVSAGRFL